MTIPKSKSTDPEIGRSEKFDDLAAQALSVVASRSTRRSTSPALIERLLEAAMGRSAESYRLVTRHMLAMGISPEFIVDEYIPAVARKMGDEWCDDISSFAQVTIGTSRLQALLRELSTFWSADRALDQGSRAAVLVAVPLSAKHTLGASVLSTQLRRAGMSVRLSVGIGPEELSQTMEINNFDAIIISASLGDSLDKVQQLVKTVRVPSYHKDLPVVVGGTILEDSVEVKAITGADLATVDLNEALEFCGISYHRT